MTKFTATELAAIRARAEKARPGPWHSNTYKTIYAGSHTKPEDVLCLESDSCADAAFIAAARTDVPALCDALEAAELEIRTLRTIHACLPSGLEHEVNVQRDRAKAAEARVKELKAQLATTRDDALEEAAKVCSVITSEATFEATQRIRALKGVKR